MKAIQSALIWAAEVGLILLWLPLLAVVRLFDRDPAHYTTGRLFRLLGNAMTRVNPLWNVHVEGDFPADPRHPYVVVANHQSSADIPVICRLPWEMKWVAKAEMFRLPVAGWLMRLAGDIPVDRKDTASRTRVLVTAQRTLRHRCSVMFFPEGTRSRDGRVRRFQTGAFRLAIEAGVPILPLALDGTRDALPKNGWVFGNAIHARLKVLPPISTEGLGADDVDALTARTRDSIIAQIAAWRGTHPEDIDALAVRASGTATPGSMNGVEETAKTSR
ncbi:MAG: 1-acyl-sn-glycerol-3-phosphate acyltransferase [Rhodothermaceae bacterium]|nr:1-acyl-sn-glycerol-3-phosphate acyltransferase [Rhodothermaceae bacterium]